MAKKTNEEEKIRVSNIGVNGRKVTNADYVLDRVVGLLTDSMERDNDYDSTGTQLKDGKMLVDYGFAIHENFSLQEKGDLVELFAHALVDANIAYNPGKDEFYHVSGPAGTIAGDAKPEEVINAIVNYALEFTEADEYMENTNPVDFEEKLYGFVDADTELEDKLNEFGSAADEQSAKKVFADVLPVMEDRYEGLTFPGKVKGTKAQKEERQKFIDEMFKLNQGSGLKIAYVLRSVADFTDEVGGDFSTVMIASAIKTADLSTSAYNEFNDKARELLISPSKKDNDAYEAQPNKPRTKAQKEAKEAAYQRVLDFWNLESQEAKEFVQALKHKDRIAALQVEKGQLKSEKDAMKGERDTYADNAKQYALARDKALGERDQARGGRDNYKQCFEGEQAKHQKFIDEKYRPVVASALNHKKWNNRFAALTVGGTLAGLLFGAYAGYQLAPRDGTDEAAQHEIEQLENENARLTGENAGYKSLLNELPGRQAERALDAGDCSTVNRIGDEYLISLGGELATPGHLPGSSNGFAGAMQIKGRRDSFARCIVGDGKRDTRPREERTIEGQPFTIWKPSRGK